MKKRDRTRKNTRRRCRGKAMKKKTRRKKVKEVAVRTWPHFGPGGKSTFVDYIPPPSLAR
jgi:hypothetical protein